MRIEGTVTMVTSDVLYFSVALDHVDLDSSTDHLPWTESSLSPCRCPAVDSPLFR